MVITQQRFGSVARYLDQLDIPRPPDVQAALDRLASGELPTDAQGLALEEYLQMQRPLVAIEDGHLQIGRSAAEWQGPLMAAEYLLLQVAPAVGGIKVDGLYSGPGPIGTLFVVAENLAVTTRHVIEAFADPIGARYQFKQGIRVCAEFGGNASGDMANILDIVLVHPVLDLALVRLDFPNGKHPFPLHLNGSREVQPRQEVCIIGFANNDYETPRMFWKNPFSKSIAPGILIGWGHSDFLGTSNLSIEHDCTTKPGMSGAPLIDLATGSVIGIQVARSLGLVSMAVPARELARDSRLRNFLNFTAETLPPDPLAWYEEWHKIGEVSSTVPTFSTSADRQRSAPVSIDEVERLVAAKFTSTDELTSFLVGLGPIYAEALAAQPGRSRSEPEAYRSALLTSLQRRGLIDTDFLRAIGFVEESSLEKADDAADGEQEWLSPAQAESLSNMLKLGNVDDDALNGMILGSPFWDMLSEHDEIRPLPKSLAVLGRDTNARARNALIWLLKRLLNVLELDDETGRKAKEEIDLVLSRLEATSSREVEPYIPGPEDILDVAYLSRGLEASRSVGFVRIHDFEREAHEMMRGGASCWLIAPDLIVTAAHICKMAPTALTHDGSSGVSHPFSVVFSDPGSTWIMMVTEVAFVDFGLDVMLLRLSAPVPNVDPLQIRPDNMTAGSLTSIHHPNLGTKSISAQGGMIISNDGHEVIYLLATTIGVAGAPVFDRDWKVVATHRARMPYRLSEEGPRIDAKVGTSAPALIDAIRKRHGGEGVWRQIVGSQRGLRVIDGELTNDESWTDPAQRRSVVIELVDADTEVNLTDGMEILAQTGRIISALATRSAIDRLAQTTGVVSVEASRSGGATECVRSIPHIGVPVVHGYFGETGDRALVAIIDSGIDIGHRAFLDDRGSSRIAVFWDQQDPRSSLGHPTTTISLTGAAIVARYGLKGGALYAAEDIDRMIAGDPVPRTFPPPLYMVHGTLVAGIAAGRKTGNDASDFPGGVAPDARIIAIRYDLDGASVGNSGGHVQALSFIDRFAFDQDDTPVVVNISNGMNSGAHDGTSPVEVACGEFTIQGQKPGRVIVKSAGNELNKARHATLTVMPGFLKQLRWSSTPAVGAINVNSLVERIELWFDRADQYRFYVQTPTRQNSSPVSPEFPRLDERLPNGNRISAQYWPMRKENAQSMLELSITKGDLAHIEDGDWSLVIEAVMSRKGKPIDAWIEAISNREVRFLDFPNNSCTITIPGTSQWVITVGAVAAEATPFPYEHGSMGPTAVNLPKPDLVGPGVRISSAAAGSQSKVSPEQNGTSFAAPHVTGVIALVMSARKKKRADLFHATMVKAGLLDTLRNLTLQPDNQTGYGSLDAEAFFRFMDGL